ncbi:hypothetical protein F2Q68_00045532 [Brassica cretica]|uniref:Uncharacterized protein n=2 Tax=Brassica cretica TaxID=69181 RepID=A0A8S9LQ93_BRACR|nr:hypothetical protein F2Q68_00045532 [Brassica cretica]KAF3519716.1 hypothetical protein DY000_02062429 [Brassica cretica]
MLNFRFSRSLPGMDGSGGVVCPAPAPVLHLSFDGRPALTPETTPSSSVMVCRHLVFPLVVVVVLFLDLIGLCLIPLICGSGFNLGPGSLEAVDEISNRSMMLSA